ncbi:MAG: ThiF family adenylyltransferase [Bryobacterales bacterium]|nr:ThiF family adenylyltransferase [Bryobacterales bacterium]
MKPESNLPDLAFSAHNERYSRQIRFPAWGAEGQRLMDDSRVAIVGCGALGSFHAAALARAGVGFLRVIDRDYVEISNLQRQWLFDEAAAESVLPKAIAASREIKRINRQVRVEAVVADLTADNVSDLLGDVHLVLDGCDNFETRYLLNDFAIREAIPWIYGGAVASHGLAMPVLPGSTACFRCLYPEAPSGPQPTCETEGVLNTITAVVAAWQVSLAYRVLLRQTEGWKPRITQFDVWTGETRQIAMPTPIAGCPCCDERQFPHLERSRRTPVSLCGRNAVQIHERRRPLDLAALRERLEPLGRVMANEFALRFFLPQYELTVFPDGRAIIKGTQDVGVARSLYAQYIGL